MGREGDLVSHDGVRRRCRKVAQVPLGHRPEGEQAGMIRGIRGRRLQRLAEVRDACPQDVGPRVVIRADHEDSVPDPIHSG